MEEVVEGKDYSFPAEEEKILALWDSLDAFKEQLRRSEGKPEYIFNDGPPFATGLPHYGHILAGTLKDIVTRYACSTGRHVSRRFGWDCHGLPVEYEIDKKLGIKSRDDVLAMGIDKYNEECRSIVMRYSKEWEVTVRRLGRWIDFENDYKTLDPSFMESVWWVFKQLHEKGLVYRGFKVMPFSTACSTSLSNFEAGLNYKDVDDPAVMVAFPIKAAGGAAAGAVIEGSQLVAWTTTPWTLPSNLALCVHPELTYVQVKDPAKGTVYIVAEARLAALPGAVPKAKKGGDKKKGKEGEAAAAAVPAGFELLTKFQGAELVGAAYEPLFPYFADHTTAFRVVADGYVTDDSGTGVVHQAPAFGEDDYRVCLANGVIAKGEGLPCPIDLNGRFTAEVTDFAGKYVKDADKEIIANIKAAGRLVDHASLNHSYPFCWRSDTPLIYRAVPSWFVKVEAIKERLLANNEVTYWVPSYVKEKRFHNWLEGAHDWAISRSRFWGTPIPIWASEDGEEIRVIGSIQELEEIAGRKVDDLHRHFIDDITIPSSRGKGLLRRIDDVFDCWFESGSMPYGQLHYPFENKELFEANFPADFVAEGLDQTRGWFYTLMVLSTALFDKPAFKNLVCNGLVLAADGKKMSKRLKNYPDPTEVIDKYGADALRLYLINSPVVRAETLRFREEGVFGVVKDVFLPWYNAYRFLVQNVRRWELETGETFNPGTTLDAGLEALAAAADSSEQQAAGGAVLDRWIAAAVRSLTAYVRAEMEGYRLYTVVPRLVAFIDQLTNIYVRYNRKRLKGGKGRCDCLSALTTLFHVLLTVTKVMAPFTPFICETMYRNLRAGLVAAQQQQQGGAAAAAAAEVPESVHWCDMPAVEQEREGDGRIQASVGRMQAVIEAGRVIREKHNRPLKQPLRRVVVVHPDPDFLADITGELAQYVTSELNVLALETCADPLAYAELSAVPDWQGLGKLLGKDMGKVAAAVKGLTMDDILAFEKSGSIELAGYTLAEGNIKVVRSFKPPAGVAPGEVDAAGDGEVLVVLDLAQQDDLVEQGLARELVNRYQKLRKKAGLTVTDVVELYYTPAAAAAAADGGSVPALLTKIIEGQASYLSEAFGRPLQALAAKPDSSVVIAQELQSIGGDENGASFVAVLAAAPGSSAAAAAAAAGSVQQMNLQ
ncbi:hypothetical protein OEZ86_009348 [Tetradesmus obliquus]|nr:hypothetical protein OEZ86_009348 [Tetradesmus obliquus]